MQYNKYDALKPIIGLLIVMFFLVSCGEVNNDNNKGVKSAREKDEFTENQKVKVEEVKELTKADKILQQCYEAHGGDRYKSAHFGFVFRDKKYAFKNAGDKFTYTLDYINEGHEISRTLRDWELEAKSNGKVLDLTDKEIKGYSNGINSVIYFATLPHKLLDPAVMLDYEGEAKIKGKKYHMLSVRFNEEGGGEDFDDDYLYWIDQETHLIDYLAYEFQVNGGGIRFRSAFNRRVVDGITFQDYNNYKAEAGIPLDEKKAIRDTHRGSAILGAIIDKELLL